MKKVLMVSFQFPPMAGSSGVQRSLRFAQHLPELGWQASVLTVHPRVYERCSEDLLAEVPAGMTVRRAFALDASRHLALWRRYPGWLARPDRWLSWLLGAVPAGLRMIREERPDVIWSSYPIATTHLVAYWLARLSGLPWVADFRDPMAHAGYPADPKVWQSYARLERKVFSRARRITFTTGGAARLYAQRFPADAARLSVIENGYSEEAFVEAEQLHITASNDSPGLLTLLHSGIVYPDWRSPVQLFRAIGAARAAGQIAAADFRLCFRAAEHEDFVRQLAAEHGIADLVHLLPPLPYAQALAEMLAADGLLLLQSDDCNDQIPAKAYEYLRARRPVLTLADGQGDTARLMRSAGLTDSAALEDGPAVNEVFTQFLYKLRTGTAMLPDEMAVQGASRKARTRELARVLNEACANPPTQTVTS